MQSCEVFAIPVVKLATFLHMLFDDLYSS